MARDTKRRIFDKRSSYLMGQSSRGRVNLLKIVFPFVAVFLIVCIVAWPYIRNLIPEAEVPYTANEVLPQTGQNTATKPQFNGVDKKNQPYVLVAEQGVQMGENNLLLSNAEFTLSLLNNETVKLRADQADYDHVAEKILMTGNVVLSHSKGYRFQTTKAWIDVKESIAYGEDPVDGAGPAGEIKSPNGFKLTDHGDHIVFYGRSQLIINR